MELLQEGEWVDQWHDTKSSGGRYVRKMSTFRSWATTDGSADLTGTDDFKVEVGRYHLYVSLACPWAHHTLVFRSFTELKGMIDISIIHCFMGENGWTFATGDESAPDHMLDSGFLHQNYGSHKTVQPTQIIPIGPIVDYNAPHNREQLSQGDAK